MKNKIINLLFGLALAFAIVPFVNASVSAMDFDFVSGGVRGGIEAARGEGQPSDLMGDSGIFKKITDIMLFAVGILSVIMLIVGGMHYVISGGKKESVASAKNTILYAIVGLIVALLSYAIVNFVVNVLMGGSGGDIYGPTNI